MFLGIDGGGTTCRARLVDDNDRLLGEGRAGSANILLGIEVSAAAILSASESAFKAAGLDTGHFATTKVGLGLAGANVPSLAAALAAHRFPFASVAVASDAVAACLGAHAGHDGGILILGTGSQGLVIANGRATALGGWGFAIGDGGSGALLGRSLVRAAVAACDGLALRTALTDRIMARLGGDPAAAVLWARSATPRDYATHAPDLFAGATAGDPVAFPIVQSAAAEVDLMIERLMALGGTRIVLMGGLADLYRPWLAPRSAACLVAAAGDALDGALRIARDGAPS
ncbi:BadF/BadG/BcrA/BcrD ATPase family protein [Lichenifustis flavocetrariae]|uniref:N-acetylglucosamine kinase n=1 Tax=Lichenifustis flavocetrariae TaxID=2949735 RepID=A0AA42CLR1_9HYPH|nr:BadF/BadG/BcrA/BcrD ATPase family protein [Lichenifustis flavocetrariae]MCW6510696.1 N-acetylglucosamine kinase [Lichenifustis flavocetrariae]